jgi:hypothetical protein
MSKRVTLTEDEIMLICNALATAGNEWARDAKEQESKICKGISDDMWALHHKISAKRN